MDFNETLLFSYEMLMSRLAEPILKRLVWKVKRELQSFGKDSNMMQSGDDTPLQNIWDEFCVQVQGEEFIFYDAYLDFIEGLISQLLNDCTEDEKIILWTQTQGYEDWVCQDFVEYDYTDVLQSACNENDICEYVLNEVIHTAADYSSKRINDFLNTRVFASDFD